MKSIILLNVSETAKILGVRKDKVTELIRDGKLKGIKFGKNSSKYKIFSSDVEDYLLREYKNTNRKTWDKRYKEMRH